MIINKIDQKDKLKEKSKWSSKHSSKEKRRKWNGRKLMREEKKMSRDFNRFGSRESKNREKEKKIMRSCNLKEDIKWKRKGNRNSEKMSS